MKPLVGEEEEREKAMGRNNRGRRREDYQEGGFRVICHIGMLQLILVRELKSFQTLYFAYVYMSKYSEYQTVFRETFLPIQFRF